jgi:hypothetical protein
MGKRLDLETVIRQLHSSNTRMGFQTYSGGMLLWVSDRLHRVRAECLFDEASPLTPEDSAARWLHMTALRLFPDSNYARLARPAHARPRVATLAQGRPAPAGPARALARQCQACRSEAGMVLECSTPTTHPAIQ